MSDVYKIKATITRLEVCSSSQGFKFWIKGTKNYYVEIADLEGIESLAGGKDERNIFVKKSSKNKTDEALVKALAKTLPKALTAEALLCKLNMPISCCLKSNDKFFDLIKDAYVNNREIILTTEIIITNTADIITLKGITLVGNNYA